MDGDYRLNHMENDIKETKSEVKIIADKQASQNEKLIIIGADMKQNLATNLVIKNAVIGFLVINILGVLVVLIKNLY